MCCANWKFMGALAALSIVIFVVQPGIDTAAIAAIFAAVAGGLKWLEAKGVLTASCEIPQQQAQAGSGVSAVSGEGREDQLRARLLELDREAQDIRQEIHRQERQMAASHSKETEEGFPSAAGEAPGRAQGHPILPGTRR